MRIGNGWLILFGYDPVFASVCTFISLHGDSYPS